MHNRKVEKDGRIRCCGRFTQLYKSKGYHYCHTCSYTYAPSGRNLGFHGSGQTKAEWEAEARACAAKYAPAAS